MKPIQDLLHRIQWDPEFAQAHFVIGYYDRVERRVLRVPLRDVSFTAQERFSFHALDAQGEDHSIPLHRIREVYRNGILIWRRAG